MNFIALDKFHRSQDEFWRFFDCNYDFDWYAIFNDSV